MLFGMIALELVLLVAVPFLVLLCIFWDSEWWAAFIVAAGLATYAFHIGPDVALAMAKNPVTLTAVLKWTCIYAVVGLVFSLIKWKFKTMKVATAFSEYLNNPKWTSDKLIEVVINYDREQERRFFAVAGLAEDERSTLFTPISKDDKKTGIERATDKMRALVETKFIRDWIITEIWNGGGNYGRVPDANDASRLLTVICSSTGFTTKYYKFSLARAVTSWTLYWPFHAILLVIDDFIRHIIDWFVERFGKMFQNLADSSFANVK